MISTRSSANDCLKARSTFSPAGRYRRPAAISARRKSPIAAIRSATGSSASAQPASTISVRGRAGTDRHASAIRLRSGRYTVILAAVVSYASQGGEPRGNHCPGGARRPRPFLALTSSAHGGARRVRQGDPTVPEHDDLDLPNYSNWDGATHGPE